jgi:trans-aconitate methyltransferase
VVAVDASPEMIARNRRGLGALAGRLEFGHDDLFDWRPSHAADLVVFCF